MRPEDFGKVESWHWQSRAEVEQYLQRQGIASMLAFDGARAVGQLYLKEYDPDFREEGGWWGERAWADFRIAEPLDLEGRWLSLGCYHVGWKPDGSRPPDLRGRGIGTALLRATIRWLERQSALDGLLSWAPVPGSRKLLGEAGQMPYNVYRRFGFLDVKEVYDPRWEKFLRDAVGLEDREGRDDPRLLRVMVLPRGTRGSAGSLASS